MLKRPILYPFLFVFFVILNPLINNLGEIAPSQGLRPLIVLLVVTALINIIFYWLFTKWHYASYLTFLTLLFVFLYAHLARLLKVWLTFDAIENRLTMLIVWGGLLLILGIKNNWERFGGERTTNALNIYLGITLLVGIISALPAIYKTFATPDSQYQPPASFEGAIKLNCSNSPDIYYIILDAYGRADVLKVLYGVDNSSFIDMLESKGFYIASKGHSNYLQSIFSIPSVLNFSYLESEPEGANAVQYFTNQTTNNQLMRVLKQCGYQTIAFETGFTFTEHSQVDLYLSSGSPLNHFENLLLADSPLEWLPEALYQKPLAHSYEGHRQRILYTFDQLATFIPGLPGPKMVFAHILSPHPPFVFDADGNTREPPRSYSIHDGNDYRGDWEEYRRGYAEQLGFVNGMLEETLDAIFRKSASAPIIIIQGDHGPGAFLDWDTPDKTCLWERSAIFNAYYLPGLEPNVLTPDISPVNSFRIVLNEFFDAELELLPDKTYFTSHRLTRQIIDVTEQRDSSLNCPQN
ncbi:MAG: sulfatase-like hydrolase/transferase [Anaerolineae bacterium]|nr:sulfatase-like hydrolase/transferase [Anaerolineae bacterium]